MKIALALAAHAQVQGDHQRFEIGGLGPFDELEKEGLVARIKVETDKRSSVLKLTPQGKKAFARMARAHESWLMEMLSALSDSSRNALFHALGELKLHVLAARKSR